MNDLRLFCPITFIGGSGGNFITRWLIKSKYMDKDPIILSPLGNTHKNPVDIKFRWLRNGYSENPNNEPFDDLIKIEMLKTSEIVGTKPLFFTPIHFVDLDLALQYFDKIIRITYNEDDIDTIAKLLVGKVLIDQNNMKKESVPSVVDSRKLYTKKYLEYFQPTNSANVLFISWKNLLYKDEYEFSKILSNFTEIPLNNFIIDSLTNWRNKTFFCIEEINKILKQE